MATLAFSSAGSKIYISAGVPATFDSAGFAALTYTEIKEVTNIGTVGGEDALISHSPVGDPTTYKLKGSAQPGSLAVQGARVSSDAGQVILKAAAASKAFYAIKLTLGDTTPTVMYSQGLVMSYTTNIGSVSQITAFDAKVELSGALVVA